MAIASRHFYFMIRVNLKQVATDIEANKNAPVPKVKVMLKKEDAVVNVPPAKAKEEQAPAVTRRPATGQLNPLWSEFNRVMTARAKLSNKIFDEVRRGTKKEELKALVDAIKDFQPRLQLLYDQARHVDQYGTLPVVTEKKPDEQVNEDLFSLKDAKRKLIDKRCKLLKKLDGGAQWNLQVDEDTGETSIDDKKKVVEKRGRKIDEWRAELDRVKAEYKYIDDKLKRLEGKL